MGKAEKTPISIVIIGHAVADDSGKPPAATAGHHLIINGLETAKYDCTIVDSHEQADCAVLVVDSGTIGDAAPEDVLLASALGVKQMICCCNEMQATIPSYSKERFDEIVEEVSSCLKNMGHNPNKIHFIPISGSENLSEKSTNLEWYKGPTLIEALDQINKSKRAVLEDFLHKNYLQEFTVRRYQIYPVYRTSSPSSHCELHNLKFQSTVEVGEEQFQSVELHSSKKQAEQDAARVAYESLTSREDEYADLIGLIDQDQDCLFGKSILSEYVAKKKWSQPSYSYHHPEGLVKMTLFVATIYFGGKIYVGEAAENKNDAAQKVAYVVVKSLLATKDECMLKLCGTKRKLLSATISLCNKEVPIVVLEQVEPKVADAASFASDTPENYKITISGRDMDGHQGAPSKASRDDGAAPLAHELQEAAVNGDQSKRIVADGIE